MIVLLKQRRQEEVVEMLKHLALTTTNSWCIITSITDYYDILELLSNRGTTLDITAVNTTV